MPSRPALVAALLAASAVALTPVPVLAADRAGRSPPAKAAEKAPPADAPPPCPFAEADVTAAPTADVAADAAAAAWTYRPAAADATAARAGDKPIAVQSAADAFFEKLESLDVRGNVALVALRDSFKNKTSTVQVVNLGTGASTLRASLDPATLAESVAPDGRRVVARAVEANKRRVDVYDVAGAAKLKPLVSFEPFAKGARTERDIARVVALDATRVLTVGQSGEVAAWTVGAGTAAVAWSIDLGRAGGFEGPEIALTADGGTLAAFADGRLVLIDAADGRVVGAIPTTARRLASMSFRADGRRLAALDGPTLFEFDLDGGRQAASLGLPKALAATVVRHLAGENVWLAGGNAASGAGGVGGAAADAAGAPTVVLDVAARAIVGVYKLQNGGRVALAGDRLVVSVKAKDRQALCAWLLPGKPAKPALPLATLADGAATRVAIDVQVEGDEQAKAAVRDALARQVADRGWTLATGGDATVRLVARTENGASHQERFRRMGPGAMGRPDEAATVTEKVTRLTAELGGKPAWEAVTVNRAGGFMSVKPGQSAQDAIDEQSKFNLEFLQSLALPEQLFQPLESLPTDAPTYTLAAGGVRPR